MTSTGQLHSPGPSSAGWHEARRGTWVILADGKGLGQRLADLFLEQGHEVVLAWRGEKFESLAPGQWRFDPADSEHMDQFFREAHLLEPTAPLRGIVYLWGLDLRDSMALEDLSQGRSLGCDHVISLLQRLVMHTFVEGDDVPRFWLVTRGAQAVTEKSDAEINAAQSALWGLGRSMAVEHPSFWGGLIDLDLQAPPDEAEKLFRAQFSNSAEDQIAFRDGRRFRCRLVRHAATLQQTTPRTFPANGTYLITGGLGGVGLRVARWLVERGARHLVLVSRSGLPDRSLWRSLSSKDEFVSRRIAAVLELEALGAHVHLETFDVASEEHLSGFLKRHHDELRPPLRGVFHAAGVIEDVPLMELNEEKLSRVLRPKVAGASSLFKHVPVAALDFVVLFSSAAALLGARGSAAYTAANAVLDALARKWRAQMVSALSINWGSWEGTGMAGLDERDKKLAAQGIRSMTPDQALLGLEYALSASLPQLGVLSVDWNHYSQENVRAGAACFLKNILAENYSDIERSDSEPATEQINTTSGANAPARRERETAPTERLIRQHVGELLKRRPESLDPERPLNTLGLDSIMAVQIKNELELHCGVSLPIRDIAQSSIKELERRVLEGIETATDQ